MTMLASRSRVTRSRWRLHLSPRFQSTSPVRKTLSLLSLGAASVFMAGSAYVGGAYYALHNESFKSLWLQYAPLASDSLYWIEKWSKQDFSKSFDDAVSQVTKSFNETTSVVKEYTQTVTSAANRGYQKSVEILEHSKENVDTALQVASDKSNDVKKLLKQAKTSVEEASNVITETVHSVVDVVSGHDRKPNAPVDEVSEKNLQVHKPPPTATAPPVNEEPIIPTGQGIESSSEHLKSTVEQTAHDSPNKDETASDMMVITQVVDQLPKESIARHLAESLSQLAFILGDITAGVQKGQLTLDEDALSKVIQARRDLIRASERLSGLQLEEATLIAQALDEQSAKFYAIVENQMLLHKEELEKVAEDWQERFDEAITKTRQELAAQHQKEMVELLADQASMFIAEFDNEMKKQAQDIDRRWETEVKRRLDEEREGRLARLDHLALKLKLLEKMNITVGEAVDRSQQVQTLWASVRALKDVLQNNRHSTPFKQELAILRKAAQVHSYPIVMTVVDSLSDELAAFGVPTLFDLQNRFQSVAKAMRKAQFMPREGGGPVSYAMSVVLSNLVFKKIGCVPGDDVEAVLARAEYYLEKGDVDSAARQMNQMKGTVGRLGRDWMKMARQYLHVHQAVEIIETHLELMDLNVL